MARYPNKTTTKHQINTPLVTKLDNGSAGRSKAGDRTEPVAALITSFRNLIHDGQLLSEAGAFVDFLRRYETGPIPFTLDPYGIIEPKTVANTFYEATAFRLPSAGTYRLMLTQDVWNIAHSYTFTAYFFWSISQYRNGVSLGTEIPTLRRMPFNFVPYDPVSEPPNHYQYVYIAVFEGNPGDIIKVNAGSYSYAPGELETSSAIFPEFIEIQLIR